MKAGSKITPLIVFFLGLLVASGSYAQTMAERSNRAVYNRIEFFFNIQQPDSIYQLASDSFRAEIGLDAVKERVQYFSVFGKMTDTEVVGFSQGIGEYEARIGEKFVRVKLSVDSNLRYDFFQIREVAARPVETKSELVISNVDKVDALDHFVDSVARTYIQQRHTQSLSIGLIKDNQVKTYFYGETQAGNNTLPNANSIYEIGSLTKTFTATLLANLVENGIIQLEDSIAKFLPDSVASNPAIQKITFKSLANHTSGLPRLPDNLEQVADFDPQNPYATYGREELFDFLSNFQAAREPGEDFEYSNLGYGLLGELMNIISQQPYNELVLDTIARPLAMSNTAQGLDTKEQSLVAPHNAQGEAVVPWTFQAMSGTGALRSTVNDLLRFAHTQFLIPDNTLEEAMMLTRQFSYFIPPNTDIGLAWHMNMLGDVIYYWHNGGTAGSSSFLAIAPDKSVALVVLANSAISVDTISEQILHRILSAP